jgi:hypothetical protein
MLHACLYTIFFVFCYSSWHFYSFSGTNLLMRRHSASSLFSAIFVLQKSYTGNILRIGQSKSRTSYFSRTRVRVQSRDGGGPGPGHTQGQRGQALAHATRGWAHLVHLLTPPFRLYIPLDGKNLRPDQFSTKPTASRRHHWCEIGRIQKLFSAPCRRGESPSEAFFITMVASGVMCELSTLDYGSIAVARWLSSLPCASCLDLVSCLSWSRSSLCNSTCCVCWDPMDIDTMSSWCAKLLSLCYLYVVYDLARSPLLVDILAE